MIPDLTKISIDDNLSKIEQFINEIIISPKQNLKYWSEITKQTPAVKLGYIGQHLASLITGVQGTGTGARGDDLCDRSEVKSCNKIDQADKCKDCGERVMRYETQCSNCNSKSIVRKDDSKWLFSVRDEHELNQYLNMDRIFLLLMDYPNFDRKEFNNIRISSYEIYPKEERMKEFGGLLRNHYWNIFRPKQEANQKTNPMNFHPFSYQFYKCNPIMTFCCTIENIDTNPKILIDKSNYIKPDVERNDTINTIPMPTSLLKGSEWDELLNNHCYIDLIEQMNPALELNEFRQLSGKRKSKVLPFLNENNRKKLSMREIISTRQRQHYTR